MAIVVQLVTGAPFLLALLIAAGLCFRHATDQRRRAILVGVATSIHLVNHVLSFGYGYLWNTIRDATGSTEVAQVAIGWTRSLPSAVAFLLLIYAAFYGHERPHPDDFPDE